MLGQTRVAMFNQNVGSCYYAYIAHKYRFDVYKSYEGSLHRFLRKGGGAVETKKCKTTQYAPASTGRYPPSAGGHQSAAPPPFRRGARHALPDGPSLQGPHPLPHGPQRTPSVN